MIDGIFYIRYVLSVDKGSSNKNNNTNLSNNHQKVQSETNEITNMTSIAKGRNLLSNTSHKHEYKVGDLVGVIIDEILTINIELKVLVCKILSIELVQDDTYTYQLCTNSCIISSKFQEADLLNLSHCNFSYLHFVDSTILPILTFSEACKNSSLK